MRLMGVATAQHSQILDVGTRKILVAKSQAMFRRGWDIAEPSLQNPIGRSVSKITWSQP
jgi:hypothetical protein